MDARASVRKINLESNKAKSTRAGKNDEAEMTNDEGMTNLKWRKSSARSLALSHWTFVIRHFALHCAHAVTVETVSSPA
jgi:hypothetical protein